MNCPVTLSKGFVLSFPFCIQAKNENEIKNAKIFRRPMSRCYVGETFESYNWDDEHQCCRTYGISNMWTFFSRQFNSQRNVGQMGCPANRMLEN